MAVPGRLLLGLLLGPLLAPAPATAESETLELRNGDKVTGEVVERTDETIVLVHDALGRLEIAVADLKPPEPPRPGLFGSGWLEGWTRTARLGVSGQKGNSETSDLIAALDAAAENDTRRWKFESRFNLSSSEGETTNENAMVGLGRDWLLPGSRLFGFARGRFDYDDFRSWQLRLQGEGGLGYAFLQRETFQLRGRTGPSVLQEWNEDEFRAEWLAGPEIVWQLTPTQKIEASNFFYWSFTPWAEYRNLSDLHWRWDLMENPGLSLKAGVENEFQSDVEPGSEKNDLKYYTTIGLDF